MGRTVLPAVMLMLIIMKQIPNLVSGPRKLNCKVEFFLVMCHMDLQNVTWNICTTYLNLL